MSGYAICMGECMACQQVFSFNPVRVPSLRVEGGPRQPICRTCFDRLNAKRMEMGLEAWAPPHADAYEACKEEELG